MATKKPDKEQDPLDAIDPITKLNLKQELFCQLYTSEKEFFGNGVQAYVEAYDPDTSKPNWYKTCVSAASRLLTNVKVIDRINELLEEQGLNDSFVDKQLKFIITQHADFGSKMAAIREYNKLKSRITDKTDINITGVTVSAEQAEQLIRARAKRGNS